MAKPSKARVSGNGGGALAASAAIYRPGRARLRQDERNTIAQQWQIEVYRHLNICGEARYASNLFAAIAARAEIGVSEPQALGRKAVWAAIEKAKAENETLAELAPTVRERNKMIRDYMLHYVAAGECYLISRARQDTDPDQTNPYPVWEIVAVTELRRVGDNWEVRHDNNTWLPLEPDDPVIRMWNPDPSERREAWSPMRSLLPTLREIEFLTAHIFTQVKSRLMSAGVWFLPDNLTFPNPPPDAVEGGAEAIAGMNEAERFMVTLADSALQALDPDEVSFPTVVMSEASALDAVDQSKLIKFWSEIDDAAMVLRDAAVRRFALGMDLPPEQILGASGLAVGGSGGSAGSVNHWGVWANEEQTISAHIEPALDTFVSVLTTGFLREAVPGTPYVIAYDTASLRLRQDRSKEAIELWDRGLLNGEVTLREVGFDPEHDLMPSEERVIWLLMKMAGGSASPEMVQAAMKLLGADLPVVAAPESAGRPALEAPKAPDQRRSLDKHPYEGPPRVQHDHSPAPYASLTLACEGLALRALEKAGNRLLNDGKRGKDKDRVTLAHEAHLSASIETLPAFDFSLAPTVLADLPVRDQMKIVTALNVYCSGLYAGNRAYARDDLRTILEQIA